MTAATHQRGGLLCGLITHQLFIAPLYSNANTFSNFLSLRFIVSRQRSDHYYLTLICEVLKLENFFLFHPNLLPLTSNIERLRIVFYPLPFSLS